MALHKAPLSPLRNGLYFLLALLVVTISGNPAIGFFGKEAVYIGSLVIFVGIWVLHPLKIKRQDAFVLALFALLVTAHMAIFGSMVVNATLGFLIKLSIALLAVKMIPEFSRRYVSVMYVLSLISFFFWVPMYLGVDMRGEFSSMRIPSPEDSFHYHIGIYNLREEWDGSIRNMGMFWEPGAFAGYLMLALFFLVRDGELNAVLSKQGLALTVALLSTQSTTGYLAFMVFALFCVYRAGLARAMLVKILILPTLVSALAIGAYMSLNKIPFLGEKINQQFASAAIGDDASRINRIGNLLYDLDWILDRPIVGWSANPATRYAVDQDVATLVSGQGNGLTGFTVKFGLVGLASFIWFFAYTTTQLAGSLPTTVLGVVVVCMLLTGEQFLGFPMFLSLMFLPKKKLLAPAASAKLNASSMQFAVERASERL